MKERHLEAPGEFDYDLKNDILFFKVKNREYSRSIEMNNMVLDLDLKDFLVGLQIFEASKFFNMSKEMLRNIPNWKFSGRINNGTMEIRLNFQVKIRNKIIEQNPIIIQPTNENLPNSYLTCS